MDLLNFLQRFKRRINWRFERKSFALDELDKKLASYIKKRNGFFIEAGANDGISQTNTLYFEKYLGWHGLLIEGIPELAEKCRHNRPRCIVENCALVSCDYPHKAIRMRYCGLMSIVEGAMKSQEKEEEHIRAGLQFLREGEQPYWVTVPAYTLSEVLDRYGIYHIDLLCLDVEGYEVEVLKGIDFKRHRPHFILVEARYPKEIEAVIGSLYHQLAVLTNNESYSDVLYVLADKYFEISNG